MGESTGISWTESTWNPWLGCTKVSTGCDGCYMFREQRQYGNDPELVRRSKTKFREPLKWPDGKLVFTCSWSDWFHADADEWRPEAWEVIRDTPRHTYQILTKRPGRIHRCLPDDWGDGYPNVWLGVSIENADFTWRADQLRRVPAALRFISAEPLLGTLFPKTASQSGPAIDPTAPSVPGRDLSPDADAQSGPEAPRARGPLDLTGIDWVIVGGESGPRAQARPMHPSWAREIRDAVLARMYDPVCCNRPAQGGGCCGDPEPSGARPAFHFKQWGSWGLDPFAHDPNGLFVLPDGAATSAFNADRYGIDLDGAYRMGYMGPTPKSGGKDLDGDEWCEIPARHEPAMTSLF